ncbi:hypothetical protein HanRHA438_Chr14g0630241 [Helianthus annuus]|nr:hypothetical protein HanRHA438_Chr14g0630241 [Helianthus annuus]
MMVIISGKVLFCTGSGVMNQIQSQVRGLGHGLFGAGSSSGLAGQCLVQLDLTRSNRVNLVNRSVRVGSGTNSQSSSGHL